MLVRTSVVAMIVGVMFCMCSLAAGKQPESPTPREKYESLVKQHGAADAAWEKTAASTTPADPKWVQIHAAWPMWTYAPRFVQFAAENRQDPAALDALLKIVELVGSGNDKDRFLSTATPTARS
jgi:hypothetical protein